MDPTKFRKALACFASGVTVVTAPGDGEGPVGVTVSSFCSVSLDPPLVLVCLDNRTGCIRMFETPGQAFAVNVLAGDQARLSDDFAGRQVTDFHGHAYAAGENGAPVLAGALAHLECVVHAVHDGGDHRIVVGRVTHLSSDREKPPLVYFHSKYHKLGERH
ncbi:MAG: flavin reductase family protein [Rhodospirillaceae bacterium]